MLFEKIYQISEKVFHQDIQHLEFRPQKIRAVSVFNYLLGVGYPDETHPLVLNILSENSIKRYGFAYAFSVDNNNMRRYGHFSFVFLFF